MTYGIGSFKIKNPDALKVWFQWHMASKTPEFKISMLWAMWIEEKEHRDSINSIKGRQLPWKTQRKHNCYRRQWFMRKRRSDDSEKSGKYISKSDEATIKTHLQKTYNDKVLKQLAIGSRKSINMAIGTVVICINVYESISMAADMKTFFGTNY